jgi:hypothetical protein
VKRDAVSERAAQADRAANMAQMSAAPTNGSITSIKQRVRQASEIVINLSRSLNAF